MSIMHNDEPTLLDALDRGALIKEVGEAIACCTPPQVFGVHGDWGLGKTSFLHQVQWYLIGDCPQQSEEATNEAAKRQFEKGKYEKTVRAVWFDAWRYQHEDAPVVALLQEMRAQLSWRHQMAGSVTRNAEISMRGALLSMEEVTKKIGFQYSKFRDANREWEVKNLAVSLPSHTLREHLRTAVGQLLPKQKEGSPQPRLVVFIDDVDRCEPEAAYHLLEGLKIYLTLDNCVFILGMNQKAVEDAIGSRMESASGDNRTGRASDEGRTKLRAAAYMEKLCQNVWRLPAIRDPGRVLYDLLKTTVTDETVREWIRRAVEKPPCLPANPRRLKGLANLIGRLSSRLPISQIASPDESGVHEAQLLVIVAYVYQFHHDIYVRWEADVSLYERIYDWCRESGPALTFLTSLVRPTEEVDTDPKSPSRKGKWESTYPDPTEANVFWIQPLILSLGSEVESREFERYLHSESK